MNKIIILILSLAFIGSCSTTSKYPDKNPAEIQELLDKAEADATPGGRKILEASRTMIADQEIVVGGCWHYINAVYNRTGFSSKERDTVFKSKFKGPYFESELVRPGDWLYFVNHSYFGIEHSAIFVTWTNLEKKEALMVSYVGGNRKKPATYKLFKLDKIYNVFRAKEI